MGGIEASRGFLYQGFASILQALTDTSEWDKICVEYPTTNDKVDIALEKDGQVIKCIQVKSSVNLFSKPEVKRWLRDLIADCVSPEYVLYLIGPCDRAANTLIKSIGKYYNDSLDEEAKESLRDVDKHLLENGIIKVTVLPFDIDTLESIVRDSLHRYISLRGVTLSFEKTSFIASATVNDQMVSATNGNGIERAEFDKELEKRILLVAGKYVPQRITLGIKSFTRGTENMEAETDSCLSLIDRFDGRKIKEGYDWNSDIYKDIKDFLLTQTDKENSYQILFDAHASIAFAAGRILDGKQGIDIFPLQKTRTQGTALWDIMSFAKKEYHMLKVSSEILCGNQCDSALILGITHDIRDEVIEYIKDADLPIKRIITCIPEEGGANNFAIEDGNHAAMLADSIHSILKQRSISERRAILHIFASSPNAFMFFLGQHSQGYGKCILYEYDFEQRDSCSYTPSISFTE